MYQKLRTQTAKNPSICAVNIFKIFKPLENEGQNAEIYTQIGTKNAENPGIC